MPDIQISKLNPTPGLSGTDLFATKKGSEDFRATLDQVSQYILDNELDATTLLNLIKTVDSDTSGLNANTLQGFLASYFRNASNLNAGTVPNARLPQGSLTENFTGGGNWGTGRNNLVLVVPEFIFNIRLLVQIGYSNYATTGSNQTVTFSQPFASGWGVDNKPIVIMTQENRRDFSSGTPWNGDIAASAPEENIEVDAALWYSDLTKFRFSTKRDQGGSNVDTVRANWIAFGKY